MGLQAGKAGLRIYPGTSTLLPQGGRINLTMRRVTRPGSIIAPRRPPAEDLHHAQ